MPDITITDDDIITITLPGLTAVRIDAQSRVIAVDHISGQDAPQYGPKGTGPIHPEWIVHDLRGGTYGDFHRVKDRGSCNDPRGCADQGEHVTAYPHVHDTIDELSDCEDCIGRAAELRVLADV